MKLGLSLLIALPLLREAAAGNVRRATKGKKGSKGVKTQKTKKKDDSPKCEIFSEMKEKSSKPSKEGYAFNRVATFPICSQLEADCDVDTETVAEIVAASKDGMTLIYSDSEMEVVGFVDIEDPTAPLPVGTVELPGEPTSVAVWGDYAVVGINTSEDYVNTSGLLIAIDIASQTIVKEWDLGGQPDSVAVSPDEKYVVIAIENERDEDLGDGIPPQMPAGYVVSVETADDLDDWVPSVIDVTGLDGILFPEDPEPEFVSINKNNLAVVTLQENNGIVLIDLESGDVVSSFSAGTVDLEDIDTEEEAVIDQTSSLDEVPREPDGVVFVTDNYFVTADEGDMDGGSRGFTVWNVCGEAVYGPGAFLDQYSASVGHYPEERSGNKGVEPENVAFGSFEGTSFLFVNLERAGLIMVYDISNVAKPEFMQALPTNVGPEGGLTIPDRNLLVVANEKDGRGDKLRSTLTIYHYGKGKAQYPTLQSIIPEGDVAPIPFAALSGLSPDPSDKKVLYSIEDSFYAKTRMFKILVGKKGKPSSLVAAINIVDTNDVFSNFAPYGEFSSDDLASLINEDKTVNIDGEGIAADGEGIFYIASEGRGTIGDENRPIESLNFIFKVDSMGTILDVITLPDEWNDKQLRFGMEGIAYAPDADLLVVVLQRAWGDDEYPAVFVYDLAGGDWVGYGFYPLDDRESPNGGWVGLSDITYIGDGKFYVLERDNQGYTDARVKKIYEINVSEWSEDGDLFSKTLVKDILHITDDIGALPFEKYEGLAKTESGLWIVNDNDGVDDNSGEIQLLNIM
mmetsp:Transcript_32881/g.49613  ORF Transcript_32881/g.49613 Transcript_32881/m.49613 type:complete len:796 (+) Transcript_32881:40-2427(+)